MLKNGPGAFVALWKSQLARTLGDGAFVARESNDKNVWDNTTHCALTTHNEVGRNTSSKKTKQNKEVIENKNSRALLLLLLLPLKEANHHVIIISPWAIYPDVVGMPDFAVTMVTQSFPSYQTN